MTKSPSGPWIPRRVVFVFGMISLFADVASEMLYPLHPLFMTSVLGMSVVGIGFVEGLAEAIVGLGKIYFGRWSDQIGQRRIFVFWGYLFSAFGKPAMALVEGPLGAGASRFFDRFGKSIRSGPRDALMDDLIEPDERAIAFGWQRGLDSLGATLGPLLTLLILEQWGFASIEPGILRRIYLYSLVPGLVAVALIFLLRDKKIIPIKEDRAPVNGKDLGWSRLPAKFKTYLFAWSVFCLANSTDIFLLLNMIYKGLSTNQVIIVYAYYNFIYALSSPVMGILAHRHTPKFILQVGIAVYALVYLCFAFAKSLPEFLALYTLYGLYIGATDGMSKVIALNSIPSEQKAEGLGWFAGVTGTMTWMASLVGGILWQYLGLEYCFCFASVTALISIYFIRTAY